MRSIRVVPTGFARRHFPRGVKGPSQGPFQNRVVPTGFARRHTKGGTRMCRKILVVEDDEDVAAILADVLGEEGFEVTLAGTGREGLEHMRGDDEFCLVLMDFRMPDMGGTAFVHKMREEADWRGIPVVLVTAADPSMVRDAGVPVMHKPVGYEELVAMLETHCGSLMDELRSRAYAQEARAS
jgi:DNA-binding response OmpR family regulator